MDMSGFSTIYQTGWVIHIKEFKKIADSSRKIDKLELKRFRTQSPGVGCSLEIPSTSAMSFWSDKSFIRPFIIYSSFGTATLEPPILLLLYSIVTNMATHLILSNTSPFKMKPSSLEFLHQEPHHSDHNDQADAHLTVSSTPVT